MPSTRSKSDDEEDESEGTHYYDPGVGFPLTTTKGGRVEGKVTVGSGNHGHGVTSWKQAGTWDEPDEVHDDARLVNHIPWNAMFPQHSYLPDDRLLNEQHNSQMGQKFHTSYDSHSPKSEHPWNLHWNPGGGLF